jgi:phosphotransferase system HPr-like phosphotransfer protein
MGLGAVTGNEVRVTAIGPDAVAVADGVCQILATPE